MKTRRWVTRTTISLLAAVAALVSVAPAARAQEGPIDLLSQYDARIDGEAGLSDAGGDVNGDGVPDLLLSTDRTDNNGRQDSGSVYVVFGDPGGGEIDLDALGDAGFRIDGEQAFSELGPAVFAGHFNDDEFEDILVGANTTDNNARTNSGSAYVVFGKATTETVDLAALGTQGFRIDGPTADDQAGGVLAGGGDVTGDGRSDVVVGTPGDNQGGHVYVVFGKNTTENVDLASLGSAGYAMVEGTGAGLVSLSNESDVDGDGLDDVVVGEGGDPSGRDEAGYASVVFGKADSATIDLSPMGDAGFLVHGAAPGEQSTAEIATGGDINGDGLEDVVFGASRAEYGGVDAGAAYVVFGKDGTTTVDLANLGSGGYRIDGAAAGDRAGWSVATGGDVNGDLRADVILGAINADNNERLSSGSAYVVFGSEIPSNVDLAALAGEDGYRIDGGAPFDSAGSSVADAGDVDGDGFADVALSSNGNAHNDSGTESSIYVDFAHDWLEGACANPRSGTSGDDTLIGGEAGDDIVGGTGDDSLDGAGDDDCVEGEEGYDEVLGSAGDDTVKGGDQGDTVEGGAGADVVRGGKGHDTLDGGDEADDMEGGDGNDTITGADRPDTVKGESGRDTINGGGGDDTSLGGGVGDDTVEGDDGGDVITGGDDDDILRGGKGNDTIEGEKGADEVTGGDGRDTLFGGRGDDEIDADDGNVDTIDCGPGTDTVIADPGDVLISC